MAQPQLLQVKLSRFDAQPWGFRLQGGVDFAQPLLVQKVNAGSLSEQAGLQPGDAVIKINDVDVFNFRHKDAQDTVVRSGNNFVITVQRGGSTWRPQVTPTGNVPQANSPYLQTVTKTSLAHKQQDSQHIGCGYNNSARPFANGGGDGGVKSIVNKQYNTPVGIYSDESIAETLSAQAEVLAGGVLGVNFKKNEKEYQGDRSEVLKFLREEETGQSTPEPHSPANFYWTQSHAIGGNERRTPLHHQHQDERIGIPMQSNSLAPAALHRPSLPVAKPQAQSQEGAGQEQEQTDPRIIVLPICPALQGPEYKADMEAAAAALASDGGRPRPLSASGHPACQLCGVGIVGVFVRIKDKNLHVECFKCATCGTSLKNQGYYNFNNKLYCDIHARQAAQNNPPAGTEGYVPIPIKPNTKLSANTISSALSSHGYGSNGYSNGNSTPAPSPVASPQAALPTAAAAAATVVDSSSSNPTVQASEATAAGISSFTGNMSDEPSSIYGQMNAQPTAVPGDPAFEYVTLTGNVIRSVQAPGKGPGISYKVNQGYARPYGAAAGPPSAAPKSPVAYSPQQQQTPRPAAGGNPYATLPRTNVGHQGRNVRYQQQQQHYQQQQYQQQQQQLQQQKQQYRNSYPMGSNYNTQSQSLSQTSFTNNNNYSTFNKNNINRAQAPAPAQAPAAPKSIITAAASAPDSFPPNLSDLNLNSNVDGSAGGGIKNGKGGFGATSAPKRGRGILNQAAAPGVRIPLCNSCNVQIRGPFITALGRIWCPDHFICVNGNCRRPLQDIGFVEEKGDLYCEYCFEKYLAPTCSKCAGKIKGDCLNAIGKHFHPECFTCGQCGKVFGNRPFFLEDGNAYCEADWNELFTTKCFACGFPVEAGDRWVEALNHNYHSQCFNCTYCKQNLEGQSFYNKGGRPFCKNHAR
ncbi:PDZ and LIM domain protein Zasp isoform X10 [Drosophila pseudoobscura]|uniref:PDZ and LIM domain protein Zasp isoform X10 n=1 Tax=Drosophila pseudoobscura pseudoobscura TaxID=46245 RepID=A0A6I8VRK9_DROPS|nr:PDZ and LIM domain protein Zasp isoform X10 [Drosophila pseudoobscura]